ncbi:MAG: hypothetical protein DHS20C11_00440 [Lysobacteraceae bacterium]|nr:MAG: hypothetical protein DHS20C11_00440 [Xanthomonadaceae bacterium]
MTGSGPRKTISRAEVSRLLGPWQLSFLKVDAQHRLLDMDPSALLCPSRLDIAAKYVYAQARLRGQPSAWARHIYSEHIRAFNDFHEADGSKSNEQGFVDAFDALIDSIKVSGFDDDRGPIPLAKDQIIFNGAHRLAACLASHSKLTAIEFPQHQADRYNYAYFERRGLPADVLEAMALQYCYLSQWAKVAVVFPVGHQALSLLRNAIGGEAAIIIDRQLRINESARPALIRSMYKDEPWVGHGSAPTKGLMEHVEQRFNGSEPVTFLFFDGKDQTSLVEAKKQFRMAAGVGNFSIHISDTQEETLRLAELVLNRNARHWLNTHRPSKTPRFDQLRAAFLTSATESSATLDNICLTGSATLAAYGVRDVDDLDYIATQNLPANFDTDDISCHHSQAAYYEHALDEIIADPRLHFTFDSLKIASLPVILEMKRIRNERKDQADVAKCEALLGNKKIPQPLPDPKLLWLRIRHRLIRILRHNLPKPLLNLARLIYALPDKLGHHFGPARRSIYYRGFKVYFPRGEQSIELLARGRIYEPILARHITRTLNHAPGGPCFVDLGSGPGMMALNIISDLDKCKVICFENNDSLADCLSCTLEANNLERKVQQIRFSPEKNVPMGRNQLSNAIGERTTDIVAALRISDSVNLGQAVEGLEQVLTQQLPTLFIQVNRANIAATVAGVERLVAIGYLFSTMHGKTISSTKPMAIVSSASVLVASKHFDS